MNPVQTPRWEGVSLITLKVSPLCLLVPLGCWGRPLGGLLLSGKSAFSAFPDTERVCLSSVLRASTEMAFYFSGLRLRFFSFVCHRHPLFTCCPCSIVFSWCSYCSSRIHSSSKCDRRPAVCWALSKASRTPKPKGQLLPAEFGCWGETGDQQ